MDRLIYDPESIFQDIRNIHCDLILCNDLRCLLPDINGIDHTLIDECKKHDFPFVHIESDMEMKELLNKVQIAMAPELCCQSNHVRMLFLYQGDQDYKNQSDFQKIQEYMKSKIGVEENCGVMIYQEESVEMFLSLRQLVAANPVEMMVMNQSLVSEEGKAFVVKMKKLGIECKRIEEITLKQEQNLWQTQ